MNELQANKVFEHEIYFEETIEGHYDHSKFIHCDFSEAHIENSSFFKCEFQDCNFSNARIKKTSFSEVVMSKCKLMGISFDLCQDYFYTFHMNNCLLDYASLYDLKLRRSIFDHCQFRETDFTKTDCTDVVFRNSDFTGAHFEQTNLSKADFTSSRNFLINPENNTISKTRFSSFGALGLLYKYDIIIENS